jgi:predicted small metal-binding protein
MVTTNCQEVAGVNCSIPITGNSAEELKRNVFAHAQKDHPDIVNKMTPQDQAKVAQKIESIYRQKSAAPAAR